MSQLRNIGKGLLRGTTADFLGMPVDMLNMVRQGLLAPAAGGNPYARKLTGLLGPVQETGSSDYFAEKMGLPQGEGLPYEIARMLSPSPLDLVAAAKRAPIMQELITYHGTPHRFEPTPANPLGEFEAAKIGTGEGAQAYGHGVYLAENPKIAISYSKEIPYRDFVKKASEVYSQFDFPDEAVAALKEAGLSDAQMQLMKALEKDDWLGFDYPHQALRAVLKEPQNFDLSSETKSALQEMSSVYKADLPDEMVDRMLDWDKPLSEQPEAVRAAIEKSGLLKGTQDYFAKNARTYGDSPTVGNLYDVLKMGGFSQEQISTALSEVGIPGIKYFDAISRSKGEGARNFVVFPGEEKKVQILKRN